LQYFFYFSIFKFLVVLFFKFLGVLFFKFEGILLALKFLFYHILVLYYNFFLNMMVLADSVIFKNVVFISFVKKIKILLVSKNKYLLYFLDRYKSWGFLLYDKNSKSGSISYKFAVN